MKIESCYITCENKELNVFSTEKPIIPESLNEYEESIQFLLECINRFFKGALMDIKEITFIKPLKGSFYTAQVTAQVESYYLDTFHFSLGLRS